MSHQQKGFTLVEIMVGLVVGMLAMVSVLHVFSTAEARKRTTVSGADAQSGGAIALFMIERDARMAGWGMDAAGYADCQKVFSYCDGQAVCGGKEGPIGGIDFAPLRVVDGAGGGPDSFTVRYFADPDLASFRLPSSAKIAKKMPRPSSVLDVTTVSGCRVGDMVMVSENNQCSMHNVTLVQEQALKLVMNKGTNGPFNPSESYMQENNWPSYTTKARVSCFKRSDAGAGFSKEYAINTVSRQLERSDDTQSPAIVDELVMADIVDMQVQYGIAPAGRVQEVNQWEDATGEWAAATFDWRRVKSLRVALVARSGQYEKPTAADGTCSATTDAELNARSAWATFVTTKYPADWGCYRYKVFETVIPLRNVIWGNI